MPSKRPWRRQAPGRGGVRRWLYRQGRSQDWLAQQLGISRGMLSLILNGKRTPSLRVAVGLQARTGINAANFLHLRGKRRAA